MRDAGSQFSNCAQLIRLSGEFARALAFSNVAQKDERAAYLSLFPQRRDMRLKFTRSSIRANKVQFGFAVDAVQSLLDILRDLLARVLANKFDEEAPGYHKQV